MTLAEKKRLAQSMLEAEAHKRLELIDDDVPLTDAERRAIHKGREDFADGRFKTLDELKW